MCDDLYQMIFDYEKPLIFVYNRSSDVESAVNVRQICLVNSLSTWPFVVCSFWHSDLVWMSLMGPVLNDWSGAWVWKLAQGVSRITQYGHTESSRDIETDRQKPQPGFGCRPRYMSKETPYTPENVCLETRWLGHFGGIYVPGWPCISLKNDWL